MAEPRPCWKCPVCIEDDAHGVAALPCSHMMCLRCYVVMSEDKGEEAFCPVCRGSFVTPAAFTRAHHEDVEREDIKQNLRQQRPIYDPAVFMRDISNRVYYRTVDDDVLEQSVGIAMAEMDGGRPSPHRVRHRRSHSQGGRSPPPSISRHRRHREVILAVVPSPQHVKMRRLFLTIFVLVPCILFAISLSDRAMGHLGLLAGSLAARLMVRGSVMLLGFVGGMVAWLWPQQLPSPPPVRLPRMFPGNHASY